MIYMICLFLNFSNILVVFGCTGSSASAPSCLFYMVIVTVLLPVYRYHWLLVAFSLAQATTEAETKTNIKYLSEKKMQRATKQSK